MFNIAREDGLASWFAVTQTLFVALTLWLIYTLTKRGGGSRSKVYGWLVLTLFFAYMAVDDGAQMEYVPAGILSNRASPLSWVIDVLAPPRD